MTTRSVENDDDVGGEGLRRRWRGIATSVESYDVGGEQRRGQWRAMTRSVESGDEVDHNDIGLIVFLVLGSVAANFRDGVGIDSGWVDSDGEVLWRKGLSPNINRLDSKFINRRGYRTRMWFKQKPHIVASEVGNRPMLLVGMHHEGLPSRLGIQYGAVHNENTPTTQTGTFECGNGRQVRRPKGIGQEVVEP